MLVTCMYYNSPTDNSCASVLFSVCVMTSLVAISVFLSDPFFTSIAVASSSTRYLLPLRCVVSGGVVWCGGIWWGGVLSKGVVLYSVGVGRVG